MFEHHCVIPSCTHSSLRGLLHFSGANLLPHIPLISFFSIHNSSLMPILIMCFIKHTHIHAQTLKFTLRGSRVEYRANAPDLKASPPPQMWHQLVLSLAFPSSSCPPLLPSSFLSSFISWAHLLTLQKVFLTCLSPLPSSTGTFFPALYREHASLSETYVLCRVNALAFASPWSQ